LGGFYGAFLPTKDTPIELIQDMTPSGVITRFIEKKGEGLHHIAFEVQDIMAALDALRSRGVTIIDKAPREGARGSLVAFLHPKDSYGILIELVEHR
jgi:methylmalonyl-CoA/ethylmalonyl-CoA epimerase